MRFFARIATEVPGCQFAFIEFGGGKGVTGLFRARLDRAFGALGLNAERHCVFLPRLAPDRFVAAIGRCDVVLDSIGWSGCNSILESLAHNLPIVTFAGEMMRGRHAAAILGMMDINDTTARTIDEYFPPPTKPKKTGFSRKLRAKNTPLFPNRNSFALGRFSAGRGE